MRDKEKKHRNHRQINRRKNLTIGIVSAIVLIVILSAILLRSNSRTEQESQLLASENKIGPDPTANTAEGVIQIFSQYYGSLEKETFNANDFFNPEVSQYITLKNTTPSIINAHYRKDKHEYANPKFSIVNNHINLIRTTNEVNYYSFSINYKCYRPSRGKHQECTVDVEVGVNNLGKITSYKELKINNLKFI